VWMCADGVLVVNHDGKIKTSKTTSKTIEKEPFPALKDLKLKNNETLPTLERYLAAGAAAPKTRLILEIKPHSTKARESAVVKEVLALVDTGGVTAQTEYISFSIHICKEIVRLRPAARVAYLGGNIAPEKIKAFGLAGIDYNMGVFKKKPHWLADAKRLGLTVNVWTVNKAADMDFFIKQGVDFITTDEPSMLKERLAEKHAGK